MKRLIILLVIVALIVSACGPKQKISDAKTSTPSIDKTETTTSITQNATKITQKTSGISDQELNELQNELNENVVEDVELSSLS